MTRAEGVLIDTCGVLPRTRLKGPVGCRDNGRLLKRVRRRLTKRVVQPERRPGAASVDAGREGVVEAAVEGPPLPGLAWGPAWTWAIGRERWRAV